MATVSSTAFRPSTSRSYSNARRSVSHDRPTFPTRSTTPAVGSRGFYLPYDHETLPGSSAFTLLSSHFSLPYPPSDVISRSKTPSATSSRFQLPYPPTDAPTRSKTPFSTSSRLDVPYPRADPPSRTRKPSVSAQGLAFPTRSTTPTAPAIPTTRTRTYSAVHDQRRQGLRDEHSSTREWAETPPTRADSRTPSKPVHFPNPHSPPRPMPTSRTAHPRVVVEDTIYESDSDTVLFPRTRASPPRAHASPPRTHASPPRPAARSRAVEEGVARVQARIRERRVSEGALKADARLAAQQALQARAAQDKARAEQAMRDAWDAHERRWLELGRRAAPLRFEDVPWPVQELPYVAADVTPAAIAAFLFSPLHSVGVSRKDRVRAALLRWHPDRFGRVLAKVVEGNREAVEEAVGVVTRSLNEMLAVEAARAARQQRNDS